MKEKEIKREKDNEKGVAKEQEMSEYNTLNCEEIRENLNTKYIGREILFFDKIDSTNTKAKEFSNMGKNQGTIIIADEQTKGRGRLGKSWSSPKGEGIWMSIILKPEIEPKEATKLTQIAAAAVWEGLNKIGIETKIKWPNDIVLNGKKVCGILTEMSGEQNKLKYIIVGIGINVNTDSSKFPEEILNSATSLKVETGKRIKRETLIAMILNSFENLYEEFIKKDSVETVMKICKEKSALIGKEVIVMMKDQQKEVKAIDINEDGELLVKDREGNITKIISGEVSVRGLYGYV